MAQRKSETIEEYKARKRAYQLLWHKRNPTYNKEYGRKRYKLHGDRYRGYGRKASLKMKFGISLEKYECMLAEQNGVCKICKRPPGKYRLAVDHDHTTGKIRALLCTICNVKLHAFESEFRAKAETYLNEYTQQA